MSTIRTTIAALLLSLSFTGSAMVGGDGTARPMKTLKALKSDIASSLHELEMTSLNLDDASVNLEFIVNKEGDLAIVNVEGENCLVNTYIRQMLKGKKIYVEEHLANQVHKIKVRYVRL